MQTAQVIEIRSAVWQRLFVAVTFGFIGACSIPFFAGALRPESAGLAARVFDTVAANIASGVGLAALSVWYWWRTERYRVRADNRGIEQRTGFRTERVDWQDVASYRLERVRGTRERLMEPVLYDHGGRVLLRPVAPVVLGTVRMDEERSRFWEAVMSRLRAAGAHERC